MAAKKNNNNKLPKGFKPVDKNYKPSSSVSSPSPAARKAMQERKQAEIAMSKLGKGGSGLGRIVYEVSGAGDLMRFVRNPSLGNARNLAITAAAYAAPGVGKVIQSSRALKAAGAVRASAPARATAAAERAATTTRNIRPPFGIANATTRGGGSMSMSGISKISITKSPARAAASSLANSSRAAVKAGKNTMIANQRLVAGGKGAAAVVGGSKGAVTNMENRNKKKKK
jgi:hypothetical protein